MENNSKRFLSLLLALLMVIGMMPMGHVHAEEETVMVLGEKVTEVAVGTTYAITLAGSKNALSNQKGSTQWGTDTLATVNAGGALGANILWTLESAEGGYKVKNENGYATVSRNTAALNETGHIFELSYTDAGWTFKSLETNEYFNNLDNSGSIGGWSGDGTKFDIYTVVETTDPYGKLRGQWSTYYVDTENPNVGNEGLFSMAFDNNPSTHWHSKYQGGEDKLNGSNTFTGIIDLGNTYTLNWFSYTPRTDADSGQVTQASVYVSAVENPTENDWTAAAEHVTFAANRNEKVIDFTTQSVRYVKFVAEASSNGWVTASEFHVGYNAPAECEHSYTEEIIKEATCIDGQKKLTCSLCGHSYIETIPATREHTEESVPAVAPSLDNTGLTEGTVCSVCGHVIKAQEVIPATYNEGIVPKEHVTLTAGTWEQNGGTSEGGADLAWDDNFGTMWHTDWSGTTADKLWIQFNLSETYDATALRYKPRANAANGTITKYEIQVSHDGENFFTVKTGTWEATDSWKVAEFDAHNAMSVRLVVVEFVTDQPSKKLASAAEIRLVGTPVDHKHTFTTETVPATCTEDGFTTISCTCGDTHTTVIPATGEHTYTNEYDPTCDECGATREVKAFTSEKLTGLTGTASSNDTDDGSNIEEAFDGIKDQATNYWASVQNNNGIENNEYLIANLNGKYLINQVAYTSRTTAGATGNLNDYVIWVSTDGETWEKVAEGTIETLPGTTTIEFAPVEATHVKLTATQSVHWKPEDLNKVMAAAEFEVFKAVCEEHEYDGDQDTDCNVCGAVREVKPELIQIEKSSMTMANSLNMNFRFDKDLVENWEGYYAVLEKEGDETQKVLFKDWTELDTDGDGIFDYYYVTYEGIAAKEMTDVLTVTIYDANGKPVSEPFTDTVRDHAIRNLQTTDNALNKTMIMDMLNYGAAAQVNANYKTDNLANAGEELDDYRQYATESVAYTNQMNNTNRNIRYLANVKMVDNIQFMMAFYGVDDSMTIKVSYQHWNEGKDTVKTFAVSELQKSGSYYVITLEDTVIADGFQTITCEILDGETVVATITDSMASYAARAKENTNSDLYEAIMKFSASAKAYLEAKNNP